MPANIRWLIAGSLGCFLVFTGLLESVLCRAEEEPMHPRLSPGLKIVTGFLLPLAALVALDKYAWFWTFYPLILINMLYGIWMWFCQELPDAENPDTI